MKPTLYKKILKLINRHHLRTITVDVFDTILLNQYWPASLRNHDLARLWLPILQKAISPKITTYEIYSWHKFAQQELHHSHRPLRVDLWIDALVDLFCTKYNITLSNDQHLELLASLISTELEFTIHNTKPNLPLITQLTMLKQLHPDLKFYFLADTHFTAEQIKTLFDIFEINLFDGGLCSSDLGTTKQSGELYELLETQLSPKFDLAYNLHLGDQRLTDYLAPIAHDSFAIHYRPFRMRGLRTLVGQTAITTIEIATRLNANWDYQDLIELHSIKNTPWQEYGALTAQAQTLSAWQLYLAVELEPETNFLLTGPTATQIVRRAPQLLDYSNLRLGVNLDQATLLQAYAWLLATYHSDHWNAANLFKLVANAAHYTKRQDLYQLCFTKDYAISDLAIQSFDDQTFWSALLHEIETSDTRYTEHLRFAYETVVQSLIQDNQPLCLVNFDDDITTLYRNFAQLHGITNNIYQRHFSNTRLSTSQFLPRRQAKIEQGGSKFIAALQNSSLAPTEYFQAVLRKNFKRLSKRLHLDR